MFIAAVGSVIFTSVLLRMFTSLPNEARPHEMSQERLVELFNLQKLQSALQQCRAKKRKRSDFAVNGEEPCGVKMNTIPANVALKSKKHSQKPNCSDCTALVFSDMTILSADETESQEHLSLLPSVLAGAALEKKEKEGIFVFPTVISREVSVSDCCREPSETVQVQQRVDEVGDGSWLSSTSCFKFNSSNNSLSAGNTYPPHDQHRDRDHDHDRDYYYDSNCESNCHDILSSAASPTSLPVDDDNIRTSGHICRLPSFCCTPTITDTTTRTRMMADVLPKPSSRAQLAAQSHRSALYLWRQVRIKIREEKTFLSLALKSN